MLDTVDAQLAAEERAELLAEAAYQASYVEAGAEVERANDAALERLRNGQLTAS